MRWRRMRLGNDRQEDVEILRLVPLDSCLRWEERLGGLQADGAMWGTLTVGTWKALLTANKHSTNSIPSKTELHARSRQHSRNSTSCIQMALIVEDGNRRPLV